MKKKRSRTFSPSLEAANDSAEALSIDLAQAILAHELVAPFTKTQALEALREHGACTLDQARTTFEALLGKNRLTKSARRFCVNTDRLPWTLGRVVVARNNTLQFVSLADETIKKPLSCSNAHDLLADDIVWATHLYREFSYQCLASRTHTRVICRVWHHSKHNHWRARPLGRFGLGSIVLADSDLLDEQTCVAVVELDEDSCRPYRTTRLKGRVVEVLGDENDPDVEIDIAVRRFDIPHVFSQAAMEQAEALPETVAEQDALDRVDLRDIAFVTIDGEDARDFDDAVWCTRCDSGWRLLVAIADVSHYVTDNSALDVDAQARATSVYFPRRVVPMLPEKLSNGLCSLNPEVDRCTMVCDMVIGTDGIVSAYQFYPALIHSHARLTYTCVYDALQGQTDDLIARGGKLEDISALFELYRCLRQARATRGAIDFETSETQILFEPDTGHIAAITKREHNDAHRLIEECMLAANVCAADFIERNHAQSLYRVHDKPSPERLAAVRDVLRGLNLSLGGGDKPKAQDYVKVVQAVSKLPYSDTVQMALLRSMQQAMYSPDNIGHYGLNYPRYTHFTSPIRRYPDLLVHRTIRAILAHQTYTPHVLGNTTELLASAAAQRILREKNNVTKTSPVWARLGVLTSAAERRADQASRDVTAWLRCAYMNQFVGKTFTGVVTAGVGAGLFVQLRNLFVEGFVHVSNLGNEFFTYNDGTQEFVGERTGVRFGIGSELKVRVLKVDMQCREIDFAVVRTDSGKKPRRFEDFDGTPTFKTRSRGSKHRRR